jgi:hypothetical protein
MCANLVDASVFITASTHETEFVIDMPIQMAQPKPKPEALSTQLTQVPPEQAPLRKFQIHDLLIGLIDDDPTVRTIFRFCIQRHFVGSSCLTFQFENPNGRADRDLLCGCVDEACEMGVDILMVDGRLGSSDSRDLLGELAVGERVIEQLEEKGFKGMIISYSADRVADYQVFTFCAGSSVSSVFRLLSCVCGLVACLWSRCLSVVSLTVCGLVECLW